jgi:primosomal replication protein N
MRPAARVALVVTKAVAELAARQVRLAMPVMLAGAEAKVLRTEAVVAALVAVRALATMARVRLNQTDLRLSRMVVQAAPVILPE